MNHPLFDDVQLDQLQQAANHFVELAPGSTPAELACGVKCLNLLYMSFEPRNAAEQQQADQALTRALREVPHSAQMN